jgi:hypothetical protein
MNFDFKTYYLLDWDHAQGESAAKHVEGNLIWINIKKIDYVQSIHNDKHTIVGIGGKEIYLYDKPYRVLGHLGVE